ncbi:AAA family ATPase [uncultured Imperialibacter sp.]|uniref:AAA family ATPase n=1 Tax=uncultured Imperialibacter sp. TaxID=1672639 RepID=UPI0030D71925|tara:strand:- start:169946 stop:172084 length:2139 start_codon:yes stop_codon:yes gene_type:complete
MLIDKIRLKDFRIYQGVNEVDFLHHPEKNVTIIAGNNGYGKTTFLTSLVWCLYGKLMVDVDERFRREIFESGGYKRFCRKTINRATFLSSEKQQLSNKLEFLKGRDVHAVNKQIDSFNSFSVSVVISDIFIPSVPCNKVEVVRTFNVESEEESVEVLIDGRMNELTKEVGSEIFIHDFIMPKEIAKFFFFDAEKIVSLAEIRTVDEKRELSRAYTEVLGIKKYEDLKRNLENIRLRLRSDKATDADKLQLDKINKEVQDNEKLQVHYRDTLEIKREEFARKREEAGKLQEKLIREGSSITSEEFNDLKLLKENTADEYKSANLKFKEFLELAPFAIAANKLNQVSKYVLLEEENQAASLSSEFFKEKVKSIEREIEKQNAELSLSKETKAKLVEILLSQLIVSGNKDFKPLLDFSPEQANRFRALMDNVQNSYAERFKALVQDMKLKQSSMAILVSKLSDAETKENDLVIQEIRGAKTRIEEELKVVEEEIIQLRVKLESRINELKSLQKRQSELSKRVTIATTDSKKDETAARLIQELSVFLKHLKEKKKESLESKILNELQRLMHKQHFIARVEVVLEDDILDIEFYDAEERVINKDGLSKGEQQLYATALLKALVDESNIKFPIFIDSPLQKFDQQHANNIIKDFYPSISEQVILLPLLEKELTENEYANLHPRVSKTYLIRNLDKDRSAFDECKPSELFTAVKSEAHV